MDWRNDIIMQKTITKGTRLPVRKKRRFNWALLSMAIPAIIMMIAFNYLPLLLSWFLPFKKISYAKGIFDSPWCGLDNFKFYFQSQDAWRTTRNTVLMNLMFITMATALAIVLALLMFQLSKSSVKVYQTAIFVPYFISWIVASYIVYAFLSPEGGVVTKILTKLGYENVNLYTKPEAWPLILTICYVWKSIGNKTLLYYASLISIDTSMLEAAALDGANKVQRMLHVAIPHIRPVVIMTLLLSIGGIFSGDFGLFYQVTRNTGALYETTDVIDTYVFRALRVTGDLGLSSAVALYQSVVGFILVLISNALVKKFDDDSAMF